MKILIAPLLLIPIQLSASTHCAVPTMPVYDSKLRMTVCRDPSIEVSEEEEKVQEICAIVRRVRYLSTRSFFVPKPGENDLRVKELKIEMATLKKGLPKNIERECGK